MIKIKIITFLSISSIFASTISVAVAANVSYAIGDLVKEFNNEYSNINVRVTLGSSGKLTAQIIRGATYQVFMSANMRYPEALYENKIAITKPLIYAYGALAYFSVKEQDFSNATELLKSKKNLKIAVANPKTAPYGIATVKALKKAKIYDDIKSKFIYAESISQTVSYAVIAADIGIVAKSSLYSKNMKKYKKGKNWNDVDKKLYTPISQGVVILRNGQNNADVQAFYDFIFSEKSKDIFKKFGYLVHE